jgi:hypothetical protein
MADGFSDRTITKLIPDYAKYCSQLDTVPANKRICGTTVLLFYPIWLKHLFNVVPIWEKISKIIQRLKCYVVFMIQTLLWPSP